MEKRNRKKIKWVEGIEEGRFAILNKVVKLKLLEMIKFEPLKVIRELDMQISSIKILLCKRS